MWQVCQGEEGNRNKVVWRPKERNSIHKKNKRTHLPDVGAEPPDNRERGVGSPASGRGKHALPRITGLEPIGVGLLGFAFLMGQPPEDTQGLLAGSFHSYPRVAKLSCHILGSRCVNLALYSANYPGCPSTLPPAPWPHSVKKEDHSSPDGQRGAQGPY